MFEKSSDPECICYGNPRQILAEYRDRFERKFRENRSGRIFTFLGIMWGANDLYYVMVEENGLATFFSCAGGFEECSWDFAPVDEA